MDGLLGGLGGHAQELLMTRPEMKFAAIPLAMVLVVGCTTAGVGTGESRSGVTATYTWKESGPSRGTMTAALSTGQIYQGPFFQITKDTTIDTLDPLWVGWRGRGRWHGWGFWDPEPA
ncbi:MAG: hypothetical protein ACXU8V_22325, partial [Caulobacteraceae bacterium]